MRAQGLVAAPTQGEMHRRRSWEWARARGGKGVEGEEEYRQKRDGEEWHGRNAQDWLGHGGTGSGCRAWVLRYAADAVGAAGQAGDVGQGCCMQRGGIGSLVHRARARATRRRRDRWGQAQLGAGEAPGAEARCGGGSVRCETRAHTTRGQRGIMGTGASTVGDVVGKQRGARCGSGQSRRKEEERERG